MQYADKLESLHKSLPELLNTNPTELTAQYGMRRGHVARFVDRSSACGIQLPPNLTLPARKRSIAPRDGESEYSSVISTPTMNSSQIPTRRRMSYDQMSLDSYGSRQSLQSGQSGFDQSHESKKAGYEEKRGFEDKSVSPRSKAAPEPPPVKGIMAQVPVEPRLCGLMKPPRPTNDVTPLSTLEKIYVQRLTPEHKKGTDPWGEGALKLPPPIKVAELWSKKITLLLCLRRPGYGHDLLLRTLCIELCWYFCVALRPVNRSNSNSICYLSFGSLLENIIAL
jgi:hypothetical protein